MGIANRFIRFDFNNLMSASVGETHGLTPREIRSMSSDLSAVLDHVLKITNSPSERIKHGFEWTQMHRQDAKVIKDIREIASDLRKFKNIIFLGIGGSYLGLQAAQDALASPFHNIFDNERTGKPRIFFDGNNMDPSSIGPLMENLKPAETGIVVISKSGDTTEPRAVFEILVEWLRSADQIISEHIVAVTSQRSGSLRDYSLKNNIRMLPVYDGVGGRFSEFNIGLLHLALLGIDIEAPLNGFSDMALACTRKNVEHNPCLFNAGVKFMLAGKGKVMEVLMPFAKQLKSTAEWYIQLQAESNGKKFARKVEVHDNGTEEWTDIKGKVVNVGRTPIAAVGTSDLHSIQQNNVEGMNNKVVTIIQVDRFAGDIMVPRNSDTIIAGKNLGELISIAAEGTAWALTREERPNMTIHLPEIDPYFWGALLGFFMYSTVFEAELWNINGLNQPGVESYKNYMYFKLGKPGLDPAIIKDIKSNPLKKDNKYIIQ